MRAPRHRQRQRSLFLDLPPEIRNKIYRIALVSLAPIDLSPTNYMTTREEFAQDPETQRRYEAYTRDDTKSYARLTHRNQDSVIFRIQSDLMYVRKRLATGLFGTCTQVYSEAADYFWGANTWRFSGDQDWSILYRFLLTIGPSARSRICRLDILTTYASPTAEALASYEHRQTKNHPKLHMAKLWWNEWRPYWDDCTNFVYQMLMHEKSLRELNLLVPCGYGFVVVDEVEDMVPQGFLPKIQLVIEAGGALYGRSQVAIAGWGILGLHDSDLGDTTDDGSKFWTRAIGKEQLWKTNLDYLNGVSQLFEIEELSIHANNGRAYKSKTNQKVVGSLKAFGPCVIIVGDIDCDCWRCLTPWKSWYHTVHKPLGTRYKSLVDFPD